MPGPAPPADELDALVRLLDDPDPAVYATVRERLEDWGRAAVPALLDARAAAAPALRARLDEAVRDLHLRDLEQAWHLVLDAPAPDLERGAFLLALYRTPTLDIPAYRRRLDAWAEELRPETAQADGLDRAFLLSTYLCDRLGFTGNEAQYYALHNSCLDWVLDHRAGLPISLGVVYLLLADRLGIPAFGVDMPAHFLVKYDDGGQSIFLDLFHGGTPVRTDEAVQFLLQSGIDPHPSYLNAAPPRAILLRMLRNMVHAAARAGDEQAETDLRRLLAPYA